MTSGKTIQIGDYDVKIIEQTRGKLILSGTCRLCGQTMTRTRPESYEKPCKCHREKPKAAVAKFEMWQQCGQNYSEAARKLGVSRQAVYEAIRKYYPNVGKKRGKNNEACL